MMVDRSNTHLLILVLAQVVAVGAWTAPFAFTSRVISYSFCFRCSPCSGILLDSRNLLTAAHCKTKNYFQFGADIMSLSPQNVELDKKPYRLRNYSLHAHPDYRPKGDVNDLMIVQFYGDLPLSPDLPPLQWADRESFEDGTYWLEGFGERGKGELRPFKRTLPLRLPHMVREDSRVILFHVHQGPDVYGNCYGDSGGPIFIRRPNGRVELVAIMASMLGSEDERPLLYPECSAYIPALLNRLFPHLDWIAEVRAKGGGR